MANEDRQDLSRFQTELTNLAYDNPHRSLLQSWISDLLRLHGARWAGPRAEASWRRIWDDVDETGFVEQFGPVFGTDDQWQFQNGRPEICSISMSEFLVHGESIRNQTNLQELILHGIGGQGLVDMHKARLEKYGQLNPPEVILENLKQAVARAEQCCPFEKLLDCKALFGVKNLRFEKLGLFSRELESFAGARFLQDVESLYFYQFSDATHETYRKLGQLASLKHLDIEFWSDSCGDRGIDVGDKECAFLLASSPDLRNLRSLHLRYHEIGDEGMLALVGSQCLQSLETLDLRGNYSSITNSGLAQLAAMPSARRLRYLNLSQCDFDNDGVLALARSSYLQDLEELHLAPMWESYESWKKISGREFAIELSKPTRLPKLRRLNISNQMIGDAGIQALAHSPRFADFQKLVLTHQGISDEGLTSLATTPYLPNLKELNLAANLYGDSGLASLCQSPIAAGVEWLRLDATPNAGSLLADSRFDNLVELWVERLDESILEPFVSSASLKSLRRLIFRSGVAPSELLQRKGLEPLYLLAERS